MDSNLYGDFAVKRLFWVALTLKTQINVHLPSSAPEQAIFAALIAPRG